MTTSKPLRKGGFFYMEATLPRDSNGVYHLPGGYLAVTGETILASQHNPPLEDIAQAITDSLPRDGSAGMTSPFLLVDGTEMQPGLAFSADSDTGLRRVSSNTVAMVAGGADQVTYSPGNITFQSPASLASHTIVRKTDTADEGGELRLEKADGQTYLSDYVVFDTYLNLARIFADTTDGIRKFEFNFQTGNIETPNGTLSASPVITDAISGIIELPENGDYRLVVKIPFGGTITETVTRSISGTCTATFKVNSSTIGGSSNFVSTSEQSQPHVSGNTFSANDDIVVTISGNNNCKRVSITIKVTRGLS